jgi:pectate lyase
MRVRLSIIAAVTAAAMTALVSITQGTASAATLLSDNFEDGDSSGWSKSGGEWSVVTDGSRVFQRSKLDSELAREFAGSSWTNYTVEARVKPTGFDGTGSFAGLAARATGATTMYRLVLTSANRAELQVANGSTVTVLGGANLTVSTNTWYTLRITASGSSLTAFVNGTQVGSGSNSQFGSGRIALLTFHATARFDDVLVSDSAGPGPTPTNTASPTASPTNSPTPTPTATQSPPPTGTVIGWGAGTTGGAGGSVVSVNSASALISNMQASGSRIIQVSGTISLSGMNNVASNKTIIGVGANATITGGGLNLSGVSNVIIRNLNFRGWNDDAINVQESSTRVWIDHNSFTDGYDGAVDIKRGSDFITVSWNRIFGHDKSMLLGHSDDNGSQDIGHLRVTYHHNWFDGSGTRHPRVRFGNPVHVFNNYYFNNEYGVASTCSAGVLVEGNYFENVDEPTAVGYASSPVGAIVQRNNFFTGSGTPASGGGTVNAIPYNYTLNAASSVKSIVMAGAGTGRI